MPSLCLQLDDCERNYPLKFGSESIDMNQKLMNINHYLVLSNRNYICEAIHNMAQHMKSMLHFVSQLLLQMKINW